MFSVLSLQTFRSAISETLRCNLPTRTKKNTKIQDMTCLEPPVIACSVALNLPDMSLVTYATLAQ